MILLHTAGANLGFTFSTIILICLTLLLMFIYIKRKKNDKIGFLRKLGNWTLWIFFSFFLFTSVIYLAYVTNLNPFITLLFYIPIFIGFLIIYRRVRMKMNRTEDIQDNV